MVCWNDVELADGTEKEARGKDDAEIGECEATYDYKWDIREGSGRCSVGFRRHSFLSYFAYSNTR